MINSKQREARWHQAYELQKTQFEAKKARKEQTLKDQIKAIEAKQQMLDEQRRLLEEELRKTAESCFRDFQSFQKNILSQSERSNQTSDDDSVD